MQLARSSHLLHERELDRFLLLSAQLRHQAPSLAIRNELVACGLRCRALLRRLLANPETPAQLWTLCHGLTAAADGRLAAAAIPATDQLDDDLVRAAAMQVLAHSPNPRRFTRVFVKGIHDHDFTVRLVAVQGLLLSHGRRAPRKEIRDALLEFAKRPSDGNHGRSQVLMHLARWGGNVYRAVLSSIAATDPSVEMRDDANQFLREEHIRRQRLLTLHRT
ncbi:MAG: hypothetical protein ABMA64_14960 [Myxococcota bacterium]